METEPNVVLPTEIKPLKDVLEDFTHIIFEHDPMQVKSRDPREYEGEALSVLSRFVESALHLSDNEGTAISTAEAIIHQAFNFWFEDAIPEDFNAKELTVDLLHCFVTAYPEAEEYHDGTLEALEAENGPLHNDQQGDELTHELSVESEQDQ